jgi:SAM-dependent methyltransferase
MPKSKSRWKLRLYRLMRVKPVCEFVWYLRYVYYMKIRRSFRAFENNFGVAANEYSLQSMHRGRPSERILRLIMPLAAIEELNEESKVLSIGCRFEADLLYLAAYGFDLKNVRGLDMYSYSPWVDLGNMHDMPYPDSSWDAILLGWVISYSNEPKIAAREVIRVTRPGGLIAIGVTYYPERLLRKFEAEGIDFGVKDRIQTVKEMLALFGDHVQTIYFSHDPTNRAEQGSCVVIFSIKK